MFAYLLVLAGAVLATLPIELVFGARVWSRPRRLVLTLLPVVAVFVTWDVLAIRAGHWQFDPAQTTGWRLGNLPVEELAFFVAIPICALLTYEVMRPARRAAWRARRQR